VEVGCSSHPRLPRGSLPLRTGSIRFAAIGDSGTGEEPDETPGSASISRERTTKAFRQIFKDAAGRVCKREKRDPNTVVAIFIPALTCLAEAVLSFEFAMPQLSQDGKDLIAAHAKTLAERAQSWKAAKKYEIGESELGLAYRAFTDNLSTLQEIA